MIACLKNWFLKDEIKIFRAAVNKCYAQVEQWREKAQAAERDVMEARQVARYWREKAEKGDSLAADALFPWEFRAMKSNGNSEVKS